MQRFGIYLPLLLLVVFTACSGARVTSAADPTTSPSVRYEVFGMD